MGLSTAGSQFSPREVVEGGVVLEEIFTKLYVFIQIQDKKLQSHLCCYFR